MTDKEYGDKGSHLKINYNFYDTQFGKLIAGSAQKGVCYMAFEEDEEQGFEKMKTRFQFSEFTKANDEFQSRAIAAFYPETKEAAILHMRGTVFQLQVWQELLKIPMGQLMSYQQLAVQMNVPTASRATGTAIGRNPVAYLVPCHRVIQSGGNFGGYMWGSKRKMAIRVFEASVAKD